MSNPLTYNLSYKSIFQVPSWRSVPFEILEAELLSTISSEFHSHKTPIVLNNVFENDHIRTLEIRQDPLSAKGIPLVLLHGLCSGSALWGNCMDGLSQYRPLYAVDLLGFAGSSRPSFPSDPLEAEALFVESLESWREAFGLQQFILLGHSFGGFIAAAYALKYPTRVAHLILVDPWGFLNKPPDYAETVFPIRKKWVLSLITSIGSRVLPLTFVRAGGIFGPTLLMVFRPDLTQRFAPLSASKGERGVADYLYRCNQPNPSGELAYNNMMDYFAWAKFPIGPRLKELPASLGIDLIHGERTWLRQPGNECLNKLRGVESTNNVHVIPSAGHHVFGDAPIEFTILVNNICSKVG